MIPWWKRLLFSLLSVTMAAFVCGTLFSVVNVLVFPGQHQHFDAVEFFTGIGIVLLFSLPGWILAIPIVLIVTNYREWRFWVYLAVGSVIGPLLMFGIAFYAFFSDPHSSGFSWEANPLLILGTSVSCVTTLIYLLLMRRAQAAI